MQLHGGRNYTFDWISGTLNGCDAQINQCLNDIEGMGSWDGPAIHGFVTEETVKNHAGNDVKLFHASAGRPNQARCTLFFFKEGDQAYVAGVYQHSAATTYQLVFGRPGLNMKQQIKL